MTAKDMSREFCRVVVRDALHQPWSTRQAAVFHALRSARQICGLSAIPLIPKAGSTHHTLEYHMDLPWEEAESDARHTRAAEAFKLVFLDELPAEYRKGVSVNYGIDIAPS